MEIAVYVSALNLFTETTPCQEWFCFYILLYILCSKLTAVYELEKNYSISATHSTNFLLYR
jgi:hypothetical protein